ncbi:hypothetical protein IFM46972_07546, partial [Aspergillus udagawae]
WNQTLARSYIYHPETSIAPSAPHLQRLKIHETLTSSDMPATAASHSAHLASTTSSTRSISQTGYIVVDVTHHLAPEHPFPAAFDEIGMCPQDFDQTHVLLSRISAAGNLALAIASSSRLFSTAKVNEASPFHAVFAFYPSTDLSQPTTAKKQVAKSKIFDSKGEKLVEEVRMEGNNVVCHRMEGCMHGCDKEAKRGSTEWKAKEETYGYAADMLRIREEQL